MRKARIVFAGTARNVAPFMPLIINNISSFAAAFEQVGLVLVENDSSDATGALLQDWVDTVNAANPGHALLIQPQKLDLSHPQRTDRLAVCRNRYIQAIASSPLRDFDYLAVLDLDEVNTGPMPPGPLLAATEFLAARPDVLGVFANHAPAYYDIWALRAADWCPGDCWQEAAASGLSEEAAEEKFVLARQRVIDPSAPPIEVESAFGGLGLYRMGVALKGFYSGLDARGQEVCEHVAFHRTLRLKGGKFYILPFLLNAVAPGHRNGHLIL